MLRQIERLTLKADGRYASDDELQFLDSYAQSYPLRLRTYRKLQVSESLIVEDVYHQLRSRNPALLMQGNQDLSAKWKQDTLRVLRYTALAVLMSDTDTFRERFLFWFQTIMRAFKAEQSCEATYSAMQITIQRYLSPEEVDLVYPVLELTRVALGRVAA